MPFKDQHTVTISHDVGAGRNFVVIVEEGTVERVVPELLARISKRARVVVLTTPPIQAHAWEGAVRGIRQTLSALGIRHASFVGCHTATIPVQYFMLVEPKLVRTAVLLEPETRPHPDFFQRFADRVERVLPLGLPLRLRRAGFDGRPFLHRMRCPVLVVTTAGVSAYIRAEAEVMSALLPTAWKIEVLGSALEIDFALLVEQFQEVPARVPQRSGSG